MSSEPAIRVEGLGKLYHIGRLRQGKRTAREALVEAAASPLRRARRLLRGEAGGAAELDERLWALREVSFAVGVGEVVGVIGRNGAGKSTLLKILSRITDPSEGRAVIRGRVGSLLEVGTGFHPELTGRENVYLNGALLGMGRREIEDKMERIVAFAELERFMETPVKHYSSGMYTRLAFAVAAHLDPEILLVDEVLAVGDAAFQKKCLNRMADVARAGRTVLFVSHNMAAVQALCPRTLLLRDGRLCFDGPTGEAMGHYLASGAESGERRDLAPYRGHSARPVFRALTVLDGEGAPAATFPIGATVVLELELHSDEPTAAPEITLGIDNVLGSRVFTVKPRWQKQSLAPFRGTARVRCALPRLTLLPGHYSLKAVFDDRYATLDVVEGVPAFEIHGSDYWGSGQLPTPISQGLVVQDAHWSLA